MAFAGAACKFDVSICKNSLLKRTRALVVFVTGISTSSAEQPGIGKHNLSRSLGRAGEGVEFGNVQREAADLVTNQTAISSSITLTPLQVFLINSAFARSISLTSESFGNR